jgi:pimeloyl-ACP methyl ester carboxylesterase
VVEVLSTRYARTPDGDSIAFQVVGDGPFDLVWIPGFVSHVELWWTVPQIAAFYQHLASFSRLILFDKRGTGLSDPLPGPQSLEERFRDVEVVMDAAGSERAAIVGLSEGSAMATVFAATYPERTRALVLCGPIVGGSTPDHPAGARWLQAAERFRNALDFWGEGRTFRLVWPSAPMADHLIGAVERASASPRMAREVVEMWLEIDLRDVLSSVSVPVLVLHHSQEIFPIEAARYIADQIDGARFVEVPGIDHTPWGENSDQYLGEIEEFLTGVREHSRVSRRLATLLITDLVDSTAHASRWGNATWQMVMSQHDTIVRTELRRFDGQEVKHTGDGILAAFDGPARAIRCARSIVNLVHSSLGIDVRAGIHSGEVEQVGTDLRGLAIHVAARVSAVAGPGEVLVSNTVKELVLGSGIRFEDRGVHELKGVPDQWRLYAVAGDPGSM